MVGTDDQSTGGPSEQPGNQAAGTAVDAIPCKTKVAAGRGPAPKRNRTSDDGPQNPETSKVVGKKQRREKKDDTEVRASTLTSYY